MTISHLKQRAEFYALCLEHGEKNVEWRYFSHGAGDLNIWTTAFDCSHPQFDDPILGPKIEFRLRPRTVVIPEAVVPMALTREEVIAADPDPLFGFYIRKSDIPSHQWQWFRTAEDRDAVVAAMLAREVK